MGCARKPPKFQESVVNEKGMLCSQETRSRGYMRPETQIPCSHGNRERAPLCLGGRGQIPARVTARRDEQLWPLTVPAVRSSMPRSCQELLRRASGGPSNALWRGRGAPGPGIYPLSTRKESRQTLIFFFK